MLMRTDPFSDFTRLFQTRWGAASLPGHPVLPIDAYRRDDCVVVQIDLPGVDPQSIECLVEKDVLSVRAERSFGHMEGKEVLIAERPQGTFARELFLGERLDAEHVEATYDDGVVTLTIPIAESAKPRKVAITTGQQPAQLMAA
jgi:HSP20 family protein